MVLRGGLVDRVRARLRASAWAPVALKALGYLGAFAALAAFGSGAFAGHTPATLAAGVIPTASATVDIDTIEVARDAGADDASAPIVAADAGSEPSVTADGKVILNRATEDDLRRLPGVGPTKAKAIVQLRTKLGKFKRAEDLMRIRGIGRRSMARLRPLVVVDG